MQLWAIMLIRAMGKGCPYLPTVHSYCWGTGQAQEELISLYLVTLAVLGFVITIAQTPSVNSLYWFVCHTWAWSFRAQGLFRLHEAVCEWVVWEAGSGQRGEFWGKERILKPNENGWRPSVVWDILLIFRNRAPSSKSYWTMLYIK